MTNIEKYRKFCNEDKAIPLYSRDWWLDVVSDEGTWDVALVEIDNRIVASMPFYLKKKAFFSVITLPKLTQTMGPYIQYPKKQTLYKRLSYEKKIINQLIEQLPKVDMFNQSFHHSFTNWLPFYWKGYRQSTGYTYVIEDLSDINHVFKKFTTSTRGDIRKAEKSGIKVIDSDDIKAFYEIIKITLKQKNLKSRESLKFIQEIYNKAKEKDSVIMKFAVKDDIIYSVSLCFYDDKTLYYAIAGSNRDIKFIGSQQLVQWEMMKFASEKSLSFDFEGSMIEGVEYRNRSFGAEQKPYFNITKTDSKILELLHY
jgi:lipid II:glycine glycyltransferase (peptidoglycan interpeptide bridge formation enzyme)